MNISDIKTIVKQRFAEGDNIEFKAAKGQKEDKKIKGKILRFYPVFVVVVTNKGPKNYSYIDIFRKAKKVS